MSDFIGMTIMQVIPNDAFFTQTADGLLVPTSIADYENIFENGNGIELTITGILRNREALSALVHHTGLIYTVALTEYILNNAQSSEIATAQRNSEVVVLLNTPFANEADRITRCRQLGADIDPIGVRIL